ncbi:hypothetical protein ACT7C6_35745, partial [Bacillus paranthracis]
MGYFKGKQFERDIILVAVGYYCRFSLSYRDVSGVWQPKAKYGAICKYIPIQKRVCEEVFIRHIPFFVNWLLGKLAYRTVNPVAVYLDQFHICQTDS